MGSLLLLKQEELNFTAREERTRTIGVFLMYWTYCVIYSQLYKKNMSDLIILIFLALVFILR